LRSGHGAKALADSPPRAIPEAKSRPAIAGRLLAMAGV
jgi:hypothetical protein